MESLPEWLEEFRNPPASWHPPDELKRPTHSPARNLALVILSSDLIGNDVAELVGYWIAAMARLNIWYKDEIHTRLPKGARPRLYVLQGKVAEDVYISWCAYKDAIGDPSSSAAESEYGNLIQAIRNGVARINDFMSSNS